MDSLDRLATYVDQVPVHLRSLPDDQLLNQQPGKWSRKEILGHLIDSAINNLKRFTDAQFADDSYLVQPYNQDELVKLNKYQCAPLEHLLILWQSLNRQLIIVTRSIPVNALSRPVQFGQIDMEPRTLEWLVHDYVAHLEHHLKTLL
ncbi:DinB family protein [Spirosoma lituiforme]